MSACAQYDSFDEMATDMASVHVDTISASKASELLDSDENIIVLDAREKTEFKVSHIKGAINVGYDYFKPSSVKKLDKNAKVIIYCSVGYRSGKIGERLKDMGFKDVYNMYGGIFDWINKDFPVVDSDEQKTSKVHSYNEDWGRWLKKGEKVF